jgi:hypothetical protein
LRITLGVAFRVRPRSWYSTCGTDGTALPSEESSEERALELPAEVSPGMLAVLAETLEKDEVMMG